MGPRLRTIDRRHALAAGAGLALIGVFLLLPDPAQRVEDNEGVAAFRARVEAIRQPAADDDPLTPPVPIAEVRVLEGSREGQVLDAYLSGPGGSQLVADYRVGEEVVVTVTTGPAGSEPFVAVSDRWRVPALQAMALVFAAAVVLVGGWQGVRALIALGLTIAVIVKVLLPLVIAGLPPVPMAVIAATGVTIATIVLTEGWRRSSLAAILGTTASLALTGLLGAAATAVLGFTYVAGSDLAFLITSGGSGLDLRGILLAAFILGAVGVLDDVTVTQAVLVEELAGAGLRGPALIGRAMRVGRSHIAATINTLFLAYVGGGLPLLVVILVSQLPDALVLNDEVLAVEIARTLVGSLGIIAAVPLTTAIAAVLVPADDAAAEGEGANADARRRTTVLIATGGAVAVLLIATAALPLTSGPRSAFEPERFEPLPSPSESTPSPPAPASLDPAASNEGPRLVDEDEPVPIELDGVAVGQVTVDRVSRPANAAGSVSVAVRYEAAAPFDLRRGEWSVLMGDGSLFPLLPPDGPAALARTLPAGETLTVDISGAIPPVTGSAFVVLFDVPTATYLLAVSLR